MIQLMRRCGCQGDGQSDRLSTGEQLEGVLETLRAFERQRATLEAERATMLCEPFTRLRRQSCTQ
jgi:hypothetical protein